MMVGIELRSRVLMQRLQDRLDSVLRAVPPLSPPPAYWLDSDAGPSYCWDCAVKARGAEFEFGVPIGNSDRWRARTDLESVFYEGIDGGFDTMSDSAAACETCGKTLSYILTDDGVEGELRYFRENPLGAVRDEDSYALDRLTLNIWEGSERALLLGACVAVNQAYRLVSGDRPLP